MKKGFFLYISVVFIMAGCTVQPDAPGAAEARLQLGLYYLAQADYAAAQRNLLRASLAAPRDYRITLALARLNQRLEQTEKARQYYLQAVKQAPASGYVANNYGAFLCALGQYDEAHQQFKRAIAASEHDVRADAFELSGYCELQHGHYKQADEWLSRAIAADKQKTARMLKEAESYSAKGQQEAARLLLEIYRRRPSAAAEI